MFPVNLSTRTKPATESRKPMPKSHTRNHHILPNKSVNARRAAYHNRKLNVIDHNQFVIRSLKYTAWRPTGKVVGSVKPQWKPTGRHFALYDNCPLTRIMEPIVEPLELTLSVSSSSKVTMISRFTDCKLSDRKGQMDCSVADSMLKIDTPTALKVQDKIAVHSCLGIRGTSLSRAGKPVKKVLLMNLSDHRCSIRTVIIDPHGIRVSEVIKKAYIQSFRIISENQCPSAKNCNKVNDGEDKSSSFKDPPTDMSM
ncbi:hypothetical protein Tco_0122116 [Tanacetum coccineum]